jgi:threonine dehydrogenase-like Zn-dependent dehydrogenase
MFRAVRKFGTVSVIGDYYAYANNFPVGPMMEKVNFSHRRYQKYVFYMHFERCNCRFYSSENIGIPGIWGRDMGI